MDWIDDAYTAHVRQGQSQKFGTIFGRRTTENCSILYKSTISAKFCISRCLTPNSGHMIETRTTMYSTTQSWLRNRTETTDKEGKNQTMRPKENTINERIQLRTDMRLTLCTTNRTRAPCSKQEVFICTLIYNLCEQRNQP